MAHPTFGANCVAWWLAADSYSDAGGTTLCTDGQGVRILKDTSGNANNMSQSVAGSRPVFHDGTLGYPYITLDGVNDSMAFTAATLPTTGWTVFIQMDLTAWTGADYCFFSHSALNRQIRLIETEATPGCVTAYDGSIQPQSEVIPSDVEMGVLAITYDGTDRFYAWWNGWSLGRTYPFTTPGTFGSVAVDSFGYFALGASLYAAGSFSELSLINRYCTPAEIRAETTRILTKGTYTAAVAANFEHQIERARNRILDMMSFTSKPASAALGMVRTANVYSSVTDQTTSPPTLDATFNTQVDDVAAIATIGCVDYEGTVFNGTNTEQKQSHDAVAYANMKARQRQPSVLWFAFDPAISMPDRYTSPGSGGWNTAIAHVLDDRNDGTGVYVAEPLHYFCLPWPEMYERRTDGLDPATSSTLTTYCNALITAYNTSLGTYPVLPSVINILGARDSVAAGQEIGRNAMRIEARAARSQADGLVVWGGYQPSGNVINWLTGDAVTKLAALLLVSNGSIEFLYAGTTILLESLDFSGYATAAQIVTAVTTSFNNAIDTANLSRTYPLNHVIFAYAAGDTELFYVTVSPAPSAPIDKFYYGDIRVTGYAGDLSTDLSGANYFGTTANFTQESVIADEWRNGYALGRPWWLGLMDVLRGGGWRSRSRWRGR